MYNTSYSDNELPNRCGDLFSIQGALNAYLSDIKEHLKIWVSGTLFVLVGADKKRDSQVPTRFKMGEPKFVQRVNIRQTVKFGALLYIIASLLTIPAGICSHQHITPVIPYSAVSMQLPSFLTIINDIAQAHADEIHAQKLAQTASAPDTPPFHRHILQASQTYAVDTALIRAIIMAESSNNPKAVSHRGAQGLMQLMPRTAKWLGVEDSFNPAHNIDGGVRYFRQLLDRFEGNEELALAAYNAGSRHVRNYGGVPPFKATRRYIKKVFEYRLNFEKETAAAKNGAISS